MAVYTCPKGHSSTENDYCSECGAKIDGAPSKPNSPTPASASGGTQQSCPDCGVKREPGPGDYCEVCGFNFKTGAHGELPMPPAAAVASAPTPPPPPPPPPEPTPAPVPSKLIGWEVTITIDPTLKVDGSPDPPPAFEPVVAALRAGSNLIGRTSPRRGIHPEVALDQDDAVSHRHALLDVHADGALTLRDIGSSNGTSINGKEIKQLEDLPLNDADQVTLGHWTRLFIKAVR